MTAAFRDWVSGFAGTAVLLTLALAVTPQGSVRKVVALCGGVLLALTLMGPLNRPGAPVDMEKLLASYEAEDISGRADQMLSDIIAGQTAAYIVSKAQALGIDCKVEVVCRMGEYYPEPWSVTVKSKTPLHAKSALAELIEKEAGIPPERQKYVESTPR